MSGLGVNLDVAPVAFADFRRLARKRLPRFLFDYIDGGANDEQTMAANVADFARIQLRQRVMRDVSRVNTGTVLAGEACAIPVALAPLGLAGMMAQRGEASAARVCAQFGVPFSLSTVGICSLEEVSTAAGRPPWFQLYMLRDRDLVLSLLERALSAGTRTLVFTVDLAVTGVRRRDFRSGMRGAGWKFHGARMLHLLGSPRWVWQVGLRGKPHNFGNLRDQMKSANDLNEYKAFIDRNFDPRVTWNDIAWLRDQWPGKILIKGVMCGDDARAAADTGADGVIVSNHGGRQLDGVASSIAKLPEVAAAVGKRVEVLVDGGVRSGTDVVRAVALGARGVLIGRPWILALAARGEPGLAHLLELFQKEIAVAMALMGVNRIDEIDAETVEPA